MSAINNHSYGRFWPVSWIITQFWGPEVISRLTNPGVRLHVGHQHSQFWPILVSFVDYYSPFSGPRAISTINEPGGAFKRHQHSWFLSIFTRFMDYYSSFWGPKGISMVVEPQGVLMCWSSKLAVWADSVPFLGLLLGIGVPK